MIYKNVNFNFLKRFLLLFDGFALVATILIAYNLRIGSWPNLEKTWPQLLVILVISSSVLYLFGSFNYSLKKFNFRFLIPLALACFFSFTGVIIYTYFFRQEVSGLFGRGALSGGFLLFFLISSTVRSLTLHWLSRQVSKQRWLVLISDNYLEHFLDDLEQHNPTESYFYLVSKTSVENYKDKLGKRLLGDFTCLEEVTQNEIWSGVIVGLTEDDLASFSTKIMDLRFEGLQILSLINFYETKWSKVPVYFLNKSWFALSEGFSLFGSSVGLRLKRFFDIVGSFILFWLTLPLVIISAFLIKLTSRGPILFTQKRVGLNNKDFTIFKLRTMRADAEKSGAKWATQNDNRVTPLGKFLRKTRIDELPQLINVLRGEMSFIGPRPERPEFMETLNSSIPHYRLRHMIKPGITGLAQNLYRYGATVGDAREKLQYDLFYIKNHSLLLDLSILFHTARTVLGAKGR